jgi:hypothetical protein
MNVCDHKRYQPQKLAQSDKKPSARSLRYECRSLEAESAGPSQFLYAALSQRHLRYV